MVEMIVVLGVVAIFPAIVIANFPQIKLQFALSRTAHAFAQDVRKAQNMTLSAIPYNDSFGVPQPISGYGIYLSPTGSLGNKAYRLYADKQPANQQYDASDYIVSTISFATSEPGIVIKQIQNVTGTSTSINFSPPKPDTTITTLAAGQNTITVVFALQSNLSVTKSVSINTSGLIEVR